MVFLRQNATKNYQKMEGAFRYLRASNLRSINSADWVKRKNTTVKRKINPALHDELVFT